MFRNALPANDNDRFWDGENLTFPIQMLLSLKPKTFSESFVPPLESTSNFEHFSKKEDRHSYFISEIPDCQRLGYTTLLKTPFQNTPFQ